MQTIRLIITADDYGMCASVNTAIEECMSAGTVRSTSVMANMPAYEQASQLKRRFPDVSVGLHWNLTDGRPILKPEIVPSLVDNFGYFFSARELKIRWLLGRICKAEIRIELAAQYRQLKELAGTPDFWNTHENIHNWPVIFQFFVKVAKELDIGMMRNTLRVTVPYKKSYVMHNMAHPAQYLTNQAHHIQSSLARHKGMRMPFGMINFPDFPGGKNAIEDVFSEKVRMKISGPVELSIHPATQVEPLLFGNLLRSRVEEYQYFSQPDVFNQLQKLGCSLANFNCV